jgi:DNA polymerase-3 subunit gamma/tau
LALRQFTQDLLEMFRGMVICKVVEDPTDMLDLVGDELQGLKNLAEEASMEDLQRVVTLLMKTQSELVNSSYPLLTLEMSLVRLATLAPSQDLGKLISHIESLEKRLGSLPLPKTPSPPLRPPQESLPPKKGEAPVAESTENKGWQGLVEQVRQSRPMLGSVLEHGRPIRVELPIVEVGYPVGSFMLSQLMEHETSKDLEVLATEYFGQPVKLRVIQLDTKQVNPPSLLETRQAKETDRMRRLREDALEHPALKSVQEIFNGKIKKVIPIDKGFV